MDGDRGERNESSGSNARNEGAFGTSGLDQRLCGQGPKALELILTLTHTSASQQWLSIAGKMIVTGLFMG